MFSPEAIASNSGPPIASTTKLIPYSQHEQVSCRKDGLSSLRSPQTRGHPTALDLRQAANVQAVPPRRPAQGKMVCSEGLL